MNNQAFGKEITFMKVLYLENISSVCGYKCSEINLFKAVNLDYLDVPKCVTPRVQIPSLLVTDRQH